ncbi:chemotaxis protein [Rhodospirillum rubrum]|uniref:chemotaxis protein n=1 Tax=Rhodospirillum rubrum TaxID=1085 RepID=UPI00190311BB|nr:chemotaxis protein [Rhodospirillum rubrum]MBK1662931.1 chemotaxis protein [Rhodospirillum rubrum]MBK1675218.1 chemotaxis protein [Rhodospirillum rubrum]
MQLRRTLDQIAGAIRTASTSTEARFLEIGGGLETSVETLTSLTQTFATLSDGLKGETLARATRELSQIASRVSSLAAAQNSEIESFVALTKLIATIESRVVRMGKSVHGVGILATNTKIAAAHIGDTGVDFTSFANEINRTLRLAQTSLDEFAGELAEVGRDLHVAISTQSVLEEQQTAAIRTIPRRLTRSIEAIGARCKTAVSTAFAVGQGSQRIGRRIGDAVMALQIGDITRQRIEHADYALGLLAAPSASLEADEASHADVIDFFCQLQSRQLEDAADEFDMEIGRILMSLEDLALDAGEILRLGNDAFAASGDHQGTFLGELEKEVGAVDDLLGGFRAARAKADQIAASVSEATTRLVSHISTLRSLEADIRIMGLNTTLKCGRLGNAGKALGVIAQELRHYANEITIEASEVMADLDQVVSIAKALSDEAHQDRASDIAAVSAIMAESLALLGQVGQSLASALATLEHDGHVVADLLQKTSARTAVHEEIAEVLRGAARKLAEGPAGLATLPVPSGPEADRLFDLVVASYTMERERTVFARQAPGRLPLAADPAAPGESPSASPSSSPATTDLDDIFF